MSKLRPQEGKQEIFVTIKDDGLDENGKVIGKGEEVDFIFYGGGGGGGKALAHGQKVLTPKGWVSIEDIKTGDLVTSPKGGTTEVTGVYPQGKVDLYRLSTNDGKSSLCCGDHLWEVREAGRYDKRVLSVSQILDWQGRNLLIEHTCPVEYQDKPKLPLDPYLIGLLLGDGCLSSKSVELTTADIFIYEEVKRLGYNINPVGSSGIQYGIRGIKKYLQDLGMMGVKSVDKSIPSLYKTASVADRFSLIQGLMDSDGYVTRDGKMYFYSSSLCLIKDFQEVVRSLGGSATVSKKWVKYRDERVLSYCCYIKFVEGKDLCRLPRKRGLCKTKNNHKACAIKSVQREGSGFATCISVDSEDKLFITNDFLVTHNTWAILYDNLKYVQDPNYFSVFFRNTTVELETNLWPEAIRLYDQFLKYPQGHEKQGKFIGKAHINYQKHTITFPSGAKSVFTYMQQDKDADSWYGAEISRAYFDEFQRQKEYCFDIIRSRLRSKAKVKSCARMTLNPDSTHFVYNYVEPYLTEEGYPDPQHECKVRYFVMVQGELHSSWDRKDLTDKFPDKTPKTYCYVPSTIEDNKILQEMEKDYKDSLDSLPEAKRKQLLLGCWHNVDNSCMYFNREYMEVQERLSSNAKRCRSWDLAGTEFDANAPAGSYARNPDYTVGVLMSKSTSDEINGTINYCVEDVVRDRLSSAKVEELIIETATKDREYYGDDVIIYLPTDPNPAAERYIKGLISRLVSLGFRATTSKTNKAKVDRFIPVAVANENRLMTYIQGTWNKDYFAELEKFTGVKREMNKANAFDDQVDATADAFETLNKHKVIKPFTPPTIAAPTRLSNYRG